MKSLLAVGLFALVSVVVLSAPANASIVAPGDDIKLYRGPGTSGGLFYVDVLGKGSSTSPYDFGTFCVQLGEYVTMGATYDVFSITDKTMGGGIQLGSFAAWLYTQFTKNNITIANDQDANAVQIGIWRSMGYLPGGDGTSPIGGNYDSSLLSTLTADYYADFAWTGTAAIDTKGNKGSYIGDVRIMNLFGLDGSPAQDQLVRVMPEPMSVLVWALLAMCVGGAARSRAASSR